MFLIDMGVWLVWFLGEKEFMFLLSAKGVTRVQSQTQALGMRSRSSLTSSGGRPNGHGNIGARPFRLATRDNAE